MISYQYNISFHRKCILEETKIIVTKFNDHWAFTIAAQH